MCSPAEGDERGDGAVKRTNGAPASGFLWWVKGPRRFEAMDGRLSVSEDVLVAEPSGAIASQRIDAVEKAERAREERGSAFFFRNRSLAEPNTAPFSKEPDCPGDFCRPRRRTGAVKIGASKCVREGGGRTDAYRTLDRRRCPASAPAENDILFCLVSVCGPVRG